MFATTTIRTQDLRAEDLPPAGCEWTHYAAFALTFDPSERYRSPESCGELAGGGGGEVGGWGFARGRARGRLARARDGRGGFLWLEHRKARFLGYATREAKKWGSAFVAEMGGNLREPLPLSA